MNRAAFGRQLAVSSRQLAVVLVRIESWVKRGSRLRAGGVGGKFGESVEPFNPTVLHLPKF